MLNGRTGFDVTCQCSQCSKDPPETYSEKYRHECEIREIMRRFGTKEQIKAYLESPLTLKRGAATVDKLRIDLRKEWSKRNET